MTGILHPATSPWTPERIATLLECWPDLSISTAEIGRRVNLSKAAVIHKARRLKLPSRPSPISKDVTQPKRPHLVRPKKAGPVVHTPSGDRLWSAEEVSYLTEHWGERDIMEISYDLRRSKWGVVKKARALGLPRLSGRNAPKRLAPSPPAPAPAYVSRRPNPCCWPIGQPGTREFRFCDEAAAFGKSYCPAHMMVAYLPEKGRISAQMG